MLFGLAGVDHFVKPPSHPAVVAVEQRMRAWELARAAGRPALGFSAATAAAPLGLVGLLGLVESILQPEAGGQ